MILNNNFTTGLGYDGSVYDPTVNSLPYTDPFGLGYVNNWTFIFGGPKIDDLFYYFNTLTHLPPPSPATGYASLGFVKETSPQVEYYYDGIAQKISPLTVNHQYGLSFFKRITQGFNSLNQTPNTFTIILMKCADLSSLNYTSTGTINYPVNSQIIYCEANLSNTAWQQVVTKFSVNDNYDMIAVFPSTSSSLRISCAIDFAYPELIDLFNFNSGPTPTSCAATVGPLTPNCSVVNAQFTWNRPNGQTPLTNVTQQIQVDATNPLNTGIWTLSMSVPSAIQPVSSCIAFQPLTISSSVNVPSCTVPCIKLPKIN